jgi:hypothetical protein
MALGDVDGDGDLDAILGNGPGNTDYAGEANTIWLNDGQGRFRDAGLRLIGSHGGEWDETHSVAAADLDGDGDLDLFFGNAIASPSTVWSGGGEGGFSLSGEYRTTPVMERGYSASESAALGDLDGDGDLDAYVGNCCRNQWMASGGNVILERGYADAYNMVWWNDGSGQFTDSGQRLGNWATGAVALGDLDGDGDLDAFEANRGGGAHAEPDDPRDARDMVWLNDGAGAFADSGQRLGNGDGYAVALGDLDGDGDLDAYVGNAYQGRADQVWINDGTGGFTDSGQRLGEEDAREVTLADVDGDGDLDAFVANETSGQVWINDGTGALERGPQFAWSTAYAAALGDVDGDGDPDVLAMRYSGKARIWRNDGKGQFRRR